MKFTIIIPVYNRPDEIEELLESLKNQTLKNFDLVIVEDGSKLDCKKEVEKYSQELDIKYFQKENTGPAKTRNYGAERASGEYFIFFDSDCVIPPEYFEITTKQLEKEDVDAYGGPDAADESFSNLQKAISHSMTSLFTTGKIRGGEKIDKFYPRSFNMGIKKTVWDKIGGFPITSMFPGEDMVFSIEIIKQGFKTKLFKNSKVYHKRRNTVRTFFKQVAGFGRTRYIISRVYPETFKIFYLFPSMFTLGILGLLIISVFCQLFLLPIALYSLLVFSEAMITNKFNFKVSFLSVITSFIQLIGYGTGFISAIFKGDVYDVYQKGFYK